MKICIVTVEPKPSLTMTTCDCVLFPLNITKTVCLYTLWVNPSNAVEAVSRKQVKQAEDIADRWSVQTPSPALRTTMA